VALSRYAAGVVEAPDPWGDQQRYRQWLRARLDEHPTEIVLPSTEGAIYAAAALRRGGMESRRIIIPSDECLAITLSKYRSTQAALGAGIEVPRTAFLRAPGTSELSYSVGDLRFPLIVKWDNGEDQNANYLQGGTRRVDDARQLAEALAELEMETCGVIAQELIPGRGAGAFFLRYDGEIRLRFAHRRLHEMPYTGGPASLSETNDDPAPLAAGATLLERIRYQGVAMVEFRETHDGRYVFLEINGRLWGSLGLALRAGADFPRALLECHLLGRTNTRQPDLSRHVVCRNLPCETGYLESVVAARFSATMTLTTKAKSLLEFVWHSFDPRVQSDLFWWDDPRPGIFTFANILLQTLKRTALYAFRWNRRRAERRQMAALTRRTRWIRDRLSANAPPSLLMLCFGNIIRSPYAEARWVQLRNRLPQLPPVESAGFHEREGRPTPLRYQSAARMRGIDLTGHRSRRVTEAMVARAGLVLLMDGRNVSDYLASFPAFSTKIGLLAAFSSGHQTEVSDPYGQAPGAGGRAFEQIDEGLESLARCFARTPLGLSPPTWTAEGETQPAGVFGPPGARPGIE
jgi:protein-tyrosine-phosphatase/predicted ATP-grasp superfamily ATP-dependent carboligase